MSGDPIDLNAIEARASHAYDLTTAMRSLDDDVPALVAEVRRLRAFVDNLGVMTPEYVEMIRDIQRP